MGKLHPTYCTHGIMIDPGDTHSQAGYCHICESTMETNKNILYCVQKVIQEERPLVLIQRIKEKFLKVSIEYADQESLEQSFQHAVTEALICRHILTADNATDGKKALNDLLNWEVAASLDTSVSQRAKDLWQEGYQAALEDLKNQKRSIV